MKKYALYHFFDVRHEALIMYPHPFFWGANIIVAKCCTCSFFMNFIDNSSIDLML